MAEVAGHDCHWSIPWLGGLEASWNIHIAWQEVNDGGRITFDSSDNKYRIFENGTGRKGAISPAPQHSLQDQGTKYGPAFSECLHRTSSARSVLCGGAGEILEDGAASSTRRVSLY